MPNDSHPYQFQAPLRGEIDKANGIIRGVSLITCGLTARGHDLVVDETTLTQMHGCAKAKGKLPVKLNHQSGVENICGYITDFHIVGNKLLGDWHLLKTHDEYAATLEKAEVMPDCFGLSVAFQGKGVAGRDGKQYARCDETLAVDCVTMPAANPDGLFQEKGSPLTPPLSGMPENIAPGHEPTLASVYALLQQMQEQNAQLAERLDTQEQFTQELIGSQNQPSLEELAQATDEELAAIGLTREDVDAAVAQAQAEGGEGGEGESELVGAGGGAGAGAGAGAEGTAAVGGEFAALRKEVIELQRQVKQGKAKDEADKLSHSFAVIDSKIDAVLAQNAELHEFASHLQAENDALRLAIKTGVRAVAPGTESVRLFSANAEGEIHEFQQIVMFHKQAGKTEAQAIRLASKEHPQLHRDWVMSLAK